MEGKWVDVNETFVREVWHCSCGKKATGFLNDGPYYCCQKKMKLETAQVYVAETVSEIGLKNTFSELIPLLTEGRHIRRPSWSPGVSVGLCKGTLRALDSASNKTYDYGITKEELVATDWEVIS